MWRGWLLHLFVWLFITLCICLVCVFWIKERLEFWFGVLTAVVMGVLHYRANYLSALLLSWQEEYPWSRIFLTPLLENISKRPLFWGLLELVIRFVISVLVYILVLQLLIMMAVNL